MRGKLPARGKQAGGAGTIPASAGETIVFHARPLAPRDYPRECGGNTASIRYSSSLRGLSPRVRGKLAASGDRVTSTGTIPASAGETVRLDGIALAAGDYPRECGGNTVLGDTVSFLWGLSPRVRGKRLQQRQGSGQEGTIPASAGETTWDAETWLRSWDYPRECGGNSLGAADGMYALGLSPRVRGKRTTQILVTVPFGTIPASAGETHRK